MNTRPVPPVAEVPTRLPRMILLHPNDGCLTVARSLIRRGVQVHALADPRHEYVLASRHVTGRVIPDPRADPGTWSTELAALAADGGGVVICGSDAASEWVQRNRGELAPSLRTFETADGAHRDLMNKRELYRIAAEAGVRTPWMRHVVTRADLDELRAEVSFPCILKPTLGHVAKAAVGFGTQRLESAADLTDRADQLLEHGLDFVLTELVPGPETALLGAVTIRDSDGGYLLEYGRRKRRQWPLDYGAGTVLESVDEPEMLRLNRRLLDHVGFQGLSSCEAKRHAGNGELYLVEINVRVPANYGLAEACGVDGAWRLYAALAGIPLPPQLSPITGRKVVMHPDLLAAWSRVRRGEASIGTIVDSWRGSRDFGVLDGRDPAPTLSLATQVLRRRVRTLRAKRADRHLPADPVPTPR
jgi:D-aspartate ligase